MKKTLRFSLLALFAVLGMNNAMAQEVTLDFTLETESGSKASVWGFPAGSSNKTVDEQSFTYNGYTVKVAGSTGNGYYWHDSDHYLLFGKQGAYVTLPAFSFDVERIDIEIPGSASKKVTQNIFVGDNAVSTETTGNGTKNFLIASDKQAAGTVYTIKVTNANNSQIKKILIWKKGTSGDQKLQAGIAWSKATASVTYGNADDTQYLPTFQNPNNLTGITFSSDNSDAVSISTDGEIEVKGVGEATLTASFAGNDQYEAAEVTCKVTVKEPATEAKVIDATVAEALAVINGLADNGKTTDQYKVTGYVVGTPDFQRNKDNNELFGNVNLEIADEAGGTTTLTIFRAMKDADKNKFTENDLNMIKEGDKVVFQGVLQKYVKNGVMTPELSGGYLVSVTSGIHAVTIDDANAPAYSLDGRRVDESYRGVVIKNGKKYVK